MRTPHRNLWSQDESLGQRFQRLRNGGVRPPLRSLRELAEEFGITPGALSARLRRDPLAPKAQYRTGGNSTLGNTWYDPAAVRAWWAAKQAAKDFV